MSTMRVLDLDPEKLGQIRIVSGHLGASNTLHPTIAEMHHFVEPLKGDLVQVSRNERHVGSFTPATAIVHLIYV